MAWRRHEHIRSRLLRGDAQKHRRTQQDTLLLVRGAGNPRVGRRYPAHDQCGTLRMLRKLVAQLAEASVDLLDPRSMVGSDS